MQQFKIIFALAFLVSGIFCSLALTNVIGSSTNKKIKGEVLDDANNSIPNVLVSVYRENKRIGKDRTDPKGKYSISFQHGDPITTIRYEETDWIPCIISDISGARDHNICKVMQKEGSALSSEQASNAFLALERIHQIDLKNGVPARDLKAQYGNFIKGMKIPPVLEGRRIAVLTIYEPRI